ncbi:hypothetical protein [uncultured Bdellovibrio sp.]|uniref:hypothetical protein n=1 Tax=Bdellovibrio sp. HCB-162 TaxID=3394234 RepID=UPI0025F843FB|nr:hypothetical protein [uncultured Bdellovibrio sp.]
MKSLFLAAVVALSAPVFANAASIIKFETMYGVDGPFVGGTQIRNVLGDELPWVIKSAKGSLSTDGMLDIKVRGLVFSNDEIVPPDKRGINDEKEFRGLVSCLSETHDGKVTTVNVVTKGFPATTSGNSRIRAKIKLPKACVAPIIFVLAGSENKWFSVTGFEAE